MLFKVFVKTAGEILLNTVTNQLEKIFYRVICYFIRIHGG